MSAKLTPAQHAQLLKPINPSRVYSANGQSHVPAYDVAAHLSRIFGFGGWDKEILSLEKIVDEKTVTKNNREAWNVTYACTLRLTVRDENGQVLAVWEDGACGSSTQPQHGEALDMALKSSISYALKRCAAFGLGDQFGLSLYNKGMIAALVGQTLVGPEMGAAAGADVEAHAPVPQSMGNDETELSDVDQETGVVNTPAPAAPAPAAPAIDFDWRKSLEVAETAAACRKLWETCQEAGARAPVLEAIAAKGKALAEAAAGPAPAPAGVPAEDAEKLIQDLYNKGAN